MIPQTPVILTLPEILRHLPQLDLVSAIEQGFVDLSFSKAVVPPVGELLFDDPPGETHIKYGYIKEQDYYVIKIASGFYNNPSLGNYH
jgi:ornithine cyclodeaminase